MHRFVNKRGYWVIWLPKGHHMRNASGQALEHRVIAEEKIGRRLVKGEIVHHINGDKLDNRPENLEVLPSRWHHIVKHRTVELNNRVPGQPNREIPCACGCGQTTTEFDVCGRPRRFLRGHAARLYHARRRQERRGKSA